MKLKLVLEIEDKDLIDKILRVVGDGEARIEKEKIKTKKSDTRKDIKTQTVTDVPEGIDLSQGIPEKIKPYFRNITEEEFGEAKEKLPSSLEIFEILKSRKFAVHSLAEITTSSIGHILNTSKEDLRQFELYQVLHGRIKSAREMLLESIGGHFLRKCLKENGRRYFVYYHPDYMEGGSVE